MAISNAGAARSVLPSKRHSPSDHRARAAHAGVEVERVEQRAYVAAIPVEGAPSIGQRSGAGHAAPRARLRPIAARRLRAQHSRERGLRATSAVCGSHDRASFQPWPPKGSTRRVRSCGRELRVSNPARCSSPSAGFTKLDLVDYYLECEQAVVRHLRERPTVMKRWVDGVEGKPFFQKRVPDGAPEWIETATVTFPSGRHARELVPNDAAHLVWGVNLGVIDWNPGRCAAPTSTIPMSCASTSTPGPRCRSRRCARSRSACARCSRSTGCAAFPRPRARAAFTSTCGSCPSTSFTEVRRAALALAREVERRMPGRATSRWWKEEREGVFIDYNQNARDRTVASAYSVRAVADARVSCPLEWDEVADVDPAELRIDTVPARLRERGDPSATIDDRPGLAGVAA